MDNYYELFNINKNASTKDIINAYENKINYYNNCENLSEKDIINIKIYKKGLYILTNSNLRNNYNNLLFNNNVMAENDNNDNLNNLDDLFNVDKSWMKEFNYDDNDNIKKQSIQNNLNDRIFNVSFINNRPGYSTDSEINLRIPKQGRNIKS
jgi:DnaJ-class molecular chaperone